MSTYVHQFCVLARRCNGCYLSVQAKEKRSLNLLPNQMADFCPHNSLFILRHYFDYAEVMESNKLER